LSSRWRDGSRFSRRPRFVFFRRRRAQRDRRTAVHPVAPEDAGGTLFEQCVLVGPDRALASRHVPGQVHARVVLAHAAPGAEVDAVETPEQENLIEMSARMSAPGGAMHRRTVGGVAACVVLASGLWMHAIEARRHAPAQAAAPAGPSPRRRSSSATTSAMTIPGELPADLGYRTGRNSRRKSNRISLQSIGKTSEGRDSANGDRDVAGGIRRISRTTRTSRRVWRTRRV